VTYRYRQEILAELLKHGIVPKATTAPSFARAALNEIYRYELRQLRERLLRSEFPKAEYFGRVLAIRNRYRVMAVPLVDWTIEP
jgi:hypothetical protein